MPDLRDKFQLECDSMSDASVVSYVMKQGLNITPVEMTPSTYRFIVTYNKNEFRLDQDYKKKPRYKRDLKWVVEIYKLYREFYVKFKRGEKINFRRSPIDNLQQGFGQS